MIRTAFRKILAAAALALPLGLSAIPANAQANAQYTANQLVSAGNSFFGQVSGNLASVVEEAVSRFGLPNGYILGQTVGGAFVFGVRYGEGTLYTQNLGSFPVYWQGPSIGFDAGADASQTMMLVYGLDSVGEIYQRFAGGNANAYVVGGIGMTVLSGNGVTLVPIYSGVGARLGVSLGYLRFTQEPTWVPF